MRSSPERATRLLGFGLAALSMSLTGAPALADLYCDIAVEGVAITPNATHGRYSVDVDVSFSPAQLALAQPILVRVYVNGLPQDEVLLDVFGALSGACCSSSADCDAVAGWNVSCGGSCAAGSGGPRTCIYRRRASFTVDGVAPLSWVSAIVDPDGLHDESCPPGASNNSAGAPAPQLSFGDLALETLTVISSPLDGVYSVALGVSLTPGGETLTVAPLVRLESSTGAVFELTLDRGIGISGNCCNSNAQCPPVTDFTVSCDGACPGGVGGLHQCVYHLIETSSPHSFIPGATLTATIDPDGLFVETGPVGVNNNSVTAIVPETIASYCTGKLNSAGCVSELSYSGSPSVSLASPFVVTALDVLPGRNGLLFYGAQRASTPFLGGLLCVAQPVRRTQLQTSSGVAGQVDCSGAFALDFNARIQSGVDPLLVEGAFVAAQQWYRDAADPAGFGTSLSNALWFQIGR